MSDQKNNLNNTASTAQSTNNVEQQAEVVTVLNPFKGPRTSHLPPIEGEGSSFLLRIKDMLTLPTSQDRPAERPHKHSYNRSHIFKTGRIAIIKYDGTSFCIVDDANGKCRIEIWLKNRDTNETPAAEPQIAIFDGNSTLEFETSQPLFPPIPDPVKGFRRFFYDYSSTGYQNGFSICRFKLTVNNVVKFDAPNSEISEHDLEGILFRLWDKDPRR